MDIPGQRGLVLLDSPSNIVDVIIYNSQQESTTQKVRMVQNTYKFSIDPPTKLFVGSVNSVSVYLFYSEGTVCSIDLNVTANVSIKAGS
jgi:hypothetical protein